METSSKSTRWAKEDQPSYRIKEKGVKALTDAELLMQIIGGSNEGAFKTAREILSKQELPIVLRMNIGELLQMKVAGLTERIAASIVAVGEIARRRMTYEVKEKARITSSSDAYHILYPRVGDLAHEEFHVMCLNRSNKVLAIHTISQGGLTGTIADPRIIFNKALIDGATALILCHNHPSGSLQPSNADIDLTKKMRDIGKLMEIQILDHVIIGGSSYYSFADEGLL